MSSSKPKPVSSVIRGQAPGRLVRALRRQVAQIEGARRPGDEEPISSGCPALDCLLPSGGFRRGTLVEWLEAAEGTASGTLALLTAAEACRDGGVLVVLDQRREFYPPQAVRLGIDPEHMIVVQPDGRKDSAWALDQALRCSAPAAVLGWPEKLDGRTFRRLQLAAEIGGGLGLLIRPQTARAEPSWADVRLLVEPVTSPGDAWVMNVQLLHCRGARSGGSIRVEIDDETSAVHPLAQLAPGPAESRAAGA